jgi:hypothetical protein
MRRVRGKNKKPTISCPERQAFLNHRHGARASRGIDFHFTYEEWVAWWKQHLGSGWFEKRGRCVGQYVMARIGDKGPYASWNVKCILHTENIREGARGQNRGNARLTKAQVTVIYLTKATNGSLAKRFGVVESTVRDIKTKMTWGHVTDLLD